MDSTYRPLFQRLGLGWDSISFVTLPVGLNIDMACSRSENGVGTFALNHKNLEFDGVHGTSQRACLISDAEDLE